MYDKNDIWTFNKKKPLYIVPFNFKHCLSSLMVISSTSRYMFILQFLNSPDIPIGRVTSTPVCTQREAATPTCMSQGIAACTIPTR